MGHDASSAPALGRVLRQLNEIVVGKPREVELALVGLLAGGHLLLDDLPGVGKTTLAQALAITLGLQFQRVQFTSDLLPADVIGASIYRRDQERFEFRQGPIFTQVMLADEINRASPRTQSALLEAMAERQVTVDGQTYLLPEPFFVIATQNPVDLAGTFPLPDSQLDRFLLRISLGYPDRAAERSLLEGENRADLLRTRGSMVDVEGLRALQRAARAIKVTAALLDYVQALVEASRAHAGIEIGLSPRAAIALIAAARAAALLAGREFVLPEDVKRVFVAAAGHRLKAGGESGLGGNALAAALLERTPVP